MSLAWGHVEEGIIKNTWLVDEVATKLMSVAGQVPSAAPMSPWTEALGWNLEIALSL